MQSCLAQGARGKISDKWMEEKSLNFLFWHNLGPTYIIKVCGLWTKTKMSTGIIQKFHVYDIGKKHVVLRQALSVQLHWTPELYQNVSPSSTQGRNSHVVITQISLHLVSLSCLPLCWDPEADPRLTGSLWFLSLACPVPVLRARKKDVFSPQVLYREFSISHGKCQVLSSLHSTPGPSEGQTEKQVKRFRILMTSPDTAKNAHYQGSFIPSLP